MPQRVGVDEKLPWWDIKQLQAHSDPEGDTRSNCTDHYVNPHVVSWVEFDEGKTRNASQEELDTD